MKHSSWNSMPEKDNENFLNILKRSPSYIWSSVIFEDGTGIQYMTVNENVVSQEGMIDVLGRVSS